MFPSEVLLDRRVRTDGDTYYHREQDLAATGLPLFILRCVDRKAVGYAGDELERCNKMLQGMKIGLRLADKPPAVSYLAILGSDPIADIVAVDKAVIVMRLNSADEKVPLSYLIYDAVALSLRMIPEPEDLYSGSRVSVARPGIGREYALVHTGMRTDEDEDNEDASFFLWWPTPPSSPLPWSERKKSSFPDASVNRAHTEFSFNGHAYWVDLECGISYCSSDALLDDTTSVVESGGFIHLPVELLGYQRNSQQVAQLCACRTMGVVSDSFIRFVSIDGFKRKKHVVTVWRLLGHDKGWEKEHEFSMETLWGFHGLADVPNDLEPMYPVLSTKDTDVVYLALGEYQKFRGEFTAQEARYLLAVDMRKKIATAVPREDWFAEFVSCDFSRKALVGPCDDEGVPIHIKKKRRRHRRNVTEAHVPTKKKGRRKKRRPTSPSWETS